MRRGRLSSVLSYVLFLVAKEGEELRARRYSTDGIMLHYYYPNRVRAIESSWRYPYRGTPAAYPAFPFSSSFAPYSTPPSPCTVTSTPPYPPVESVAKSVLITSTPPFFPSSRCSNPHLSLLRSSANSAPSTLQSTSFHPSTIPKRRGASHSRNGLILKRRGRRRMGMC